MMEFKLVERNLMVTVTFSLILLTSLFGKDLVVTFTLLLTASLF